MIKAYTYLLINVCVLYFIWMFTTDAQYVCTGFGHMYNYVLERSSEYTVGVS